MSDAITCPHCGRANQNHTGTHHDSTPVDGDVSICWSCRQIGIYIDTPFGLGIRIPTPAEHTEVQAHPGVRAAIAAMTEAYTPTQATQLLRGGQ